MNFEEIKKEMDQSVNTTETTMTIDLTRGGRNPVKMIRSNMKKEILTQLIGIVVFLAYPLLIPMHDLPRAVYYIFMFITSMMTMAYVIKLSLFLRETTDFTKSTKDTLNAFIFKIKLTLEVYKSFIIAGSLLLPVSVFALMTGTTYYEDQEVFEKWFTLNLNALEFLILIGGYLLIALFIYYITVKWTAAIYGRHLKNLEKLTQEMEEE